MGRKQKYITEPDKLQARRDRQMRYYERNKSECRKKSLERYYSKKIGDIQDSK